MPAKKSAPASKNSPSAKVKKERLLPHVKVGRRAVVAVRSLNQRRKGFLARRPHRSFRRTRRRDYARSLKLPGYWAFTNHVRKTLWGDKKLFISLAVLYGILCAGLVGMASQDIYIQLSESLRESGAEVIKGNMGAITQAMLMLGTGVTGSLMSQPTDLQRLYGMLLGLMVWLTTVWLLRAKLAGRRPKLRDGLYNGAAPFFSTFLVSLLLVVQLIPLAIAAVGVGAAMSTGLLDGGVVAMLFWVVVLLLTTLSLYWISTTFIAMIIVTLPGMYPMQAIRAAGDLVVGRRMRLLLRLLWMMLVVALPWVVIMLPIILFDAWLKGVLPAIEWLPVVPIALLIMSSFTVVWMSSYVYLLYRKVVDDDAAPA